MIDYENMTKLRFANSLFELIKTKPISKVSVKEIVEHSHLSKKTFYNHFRDKYDLATWFFIYEAKKILDEYSRSEPWGSVLGKMYRLIYDNPRMYGKNWDEKELNYLINSIGEFTLDYYQQIIEEKLGKDALTEEMRFLMDYNCSAAISIVLKWVKGSIDMTPEELGDNIANAISDKLANYINSINRGCNE